MAVVGLERFKPNADRPSEFSKFWALTVAELQRVAPEARVEADETPEPGLSLKRVCYRSLGGARIAGYLLRPVTERSCPLIVHAHGYNDRYRVMTEWARRGFSVFGFDVRGFGRSAASAAVAPDGYVLTGIESPEASILRGAVADYLQAVRTAKELRVGKVTRTSFYGFSFGGALALMAAALSREPDFVAVGQPTFGWNAERRRVAIAGSTRQVNAYIERYPWRLDGVMSTLAYFDTLSSRGWSGRLRWSGSGWTTTSCRRGPCWPWSTTCAARSRSGCCRSAIPPTRASRCGGPSRTSGSPIRSPACRPASAPRRVKCECWLRSAGLPCA